MLIKYSREMSDARLAMGKCVTVKDIGGVLYFHCNENVPDAYVAQGCGVCLKCEAYEMDLEARNEAAAASQYEDMAYGRD